MEEKKRILLVEDEVALLYALQSRLSIEGFEVEAAHTGRSALKTLKEKTFHLVVLDLILPDMKGFEILEALKEDPKLSHLVCIVVSNLTEKETIDRAMALGAKSYFVKAEHKLEELVAKIKSFL